MKPLLTVLLSCSFLLSVAHGLARDSLKFPVPRGNPKQLFFLQRSQNTNTVVYELNFKNGVPDSNTPVHIFWICYADKSQKEELTSLQRQHAYGLIYSWVTGQMAVMSGASAGKTLLQIQASALTAKGIEVDPVKEKELLDKITQNYNEQLSPYYAAARLWTDGVIDPQETRKIIAIGIEAANHAPITKRYNVGVIQT